ncbi:MAG: FAD-dependent oxidoreductase, partial [Burkholderiales bacterium]|nr:FAD-dependent oxidoreductase [Burkholderiales bacterium]
MTRARLALLAAMVALVAAFFAFGLERYFSLDYFRAHQSAIESLVRARPYASAATYFGIYVAVAGLSLPGAAVMTLAGGAIFGFAWGTVLASFASSLGAMLAFLSSRFILHGWVRARFGERLRGIDRGLETQGAFYLFALRLVPVFPFFLVNLAMGLTPMRAWTFYWVSQAGMLAGTAVYVYAGTTLAEFRLSLELALALTLLGVFPLIARKGIEARQARRVYARWRRPARFDRNLVVIGAGAAGLMAAYVAAAAKAKVTLVEKHRMGGECLHTGCVPSKALIGSARLLARMRRAGEFGIRPVDPACDFAQVMERVQRVVKAVEPHDSVERYTALGVECLRGEARIRSPWSVEVSNAGGTRTLHTRSIVIAAGARPFLPPIPGLDEVGALTSDTVWELRELPRRLLVLGGGPAGCELAQCFARFGTRVTQVEKLPRLLAREDPEFSERLALRFRAEGIDLRLDHEARALRQENAEKILLAEYEGREVRIAFDQVLCALGRVANTGGYGLEELGIPLNAGRTIQTNEYLQTLYPNIYACGDAAGPYPFTHAAAHQAGYAVANALFGRFRKFRVDDSVIPWATFTDPEVARVGLNETEARRDKVPYEVTLFAMEDLDRALADGEAHGLVKVLTAPGRDRILGATIAGEHAADLIVEFVAAMTHGIGLEKLLRTIHIYPTLAEANRHA